MALKNAIRKALYDCFGLSPQNTFLFTAQATEKTKEKPIPQEKGLKLLNSFVKKGQIVQLFKQKENPNLYGMWSLILLGIGLLLTFLGIGMLFPPIAIILGIMGLKKDENRKMATWGIVLGSLMMLINFALVVVLILGLVYASPIIYILLMYLLAFLRMIF